MSVDANCNGCKWYLHLANGTVWEFSASMLLRPWLDRFASILNLKSSPENGKRIRTFSVLHPDDSFSISTDNWMEWDHFGVHYAINQKSGDIIAQVVPGVDEEKIIYSMWTVVQPIYQDALLQGGGPLHAAFLAKQGSGILVAAPGGTGKSTTFRRFPSDWQHITDDEVLIVPTNGGFQVHPFPTWSRFLLQPGDHHWDVEKTEPLRALFFLLQGEKVSFHRLDQGEAAVLISQSMRQILRRGWTLLTSDREMAIRRQAIHVSSELAKAVPCWKMYLPLDGEFVNDLEQLLEDAGILPRSQNQRQNHESR